MDRWGGLRGYDCMSQPVAVGGAQFAANKPLVSALSLALSIELIVSLRTTLQGKGVRLVAQDDTAEIRPLSLVLNRDHEFAIIRAGERPTWCDARVRFRPTRFGSLPP